MKKTIILVVSLIALLTVILYGYEFIFKKPIIESPTIPTLQETSSQTIELKEQYKDSTYTFVGDIAVPTPCHDLKSKVNNISKDVYQIEITTIAPAPDVVCAQVVTDKKFKVSFVASPNIQITALVDGVIYNVNRFTIPLDQNIDTFKLLIKG